MDDTAKEGTEIAGESKEEGLYNSNYEQQTDSKVK
jgi:hypothetical protein